MIQRPHPKPTIEAPELTPEEKILEKVILVVGRLDKLAPDQRRWATHYALFKGGKQDRMPPTSLSTPKGDKKPVADIEKLTQMVDSLFTEDLDYLIDTFNSRKTQHI